jgi:hypothetical protein
MFVLVNMTSDRRREEKKGSFVLQKNKRGEGRGGGERKRAREMAKRVGSRNLEDRCGLVGPTEHP